jgi:hypothetical protein
VTAPVLDPATSTELARVAAWDGVPVAGARHTLADVLGGMTPWRARLDGLCRALGDAECWSGRAADEAAAAAGELSRVAAAVQAAFDRSMDGWSALATSAGAAQALAQRALATAALAEAGTAAWPFPDAWNSADEATAAALAVDALAGAAAAGAAARRAADEVRDLWRSAPGWSTPGMADLLVRLGPLEVPEVPRGLPPGRVAAWWAELAAGEQEALVVQHPAAVGPLDGVPAWARDRANRLLLRDVLDDPAVDPDVARAARLLDATIREEEAAGRTVQLQLADLAGDRVVLSFGDLDAAEAVALLVPGVLTTPDDDLGAMAGDARAVAAAAAAAAPGLAVAAVAWLGYRTPQTPAAILGRATSRVGGRALDDALDGLAAARAVVGAPPPRTTVLAHSYGTVVVDEAADRPGRLAADAVVLLGSPGMSEDAASLEAAEVFDAATVADPIAWSGWFGVPPGIWGYGSSGLPVDPWALHSEYYDADRPTLAAVGEVVAGTRGDD